jgi:hypothetical protein
MKRLIIPDSEKAKGMIWVEYQLIEYDTIVEVQIRQGVN